MLNNTMYELGAMRSCIRELFEYGLRQAKGVGKENVFDYSLGNPSIPAPALVNESIRDIVENENTLQVHGYTSAAGYDGVRKAVADDLNARFQAGVRPENLFFTCGAAPALVSVLKALITGPEAEILTVAPFFPEYRPFTEANGGKFTVVPRIWSISRSTSKPWRPPSMPIPRASSSIPPTTPPAWSTPARRWSAWPRSCAPRGRNSAIPSI